MRLRTKVFSIFTAIAIIPLIIITIFSYSKYVQTTHDRMNEISSTLFNNALEDINNTLTSVKQTAGLFSFYPDTGFSVISYLDKFSDPDEGYDAYDAFLANQNMKIFCQNALYTNDYIYGIYILTPSGAVLGNTIGKNGDIKQNYNPKEEEWYADTLALDGGLYVSDVDTHDLFTGVKSSIFFAQRLENIYTHKFLGILIIDCDPNIFNLSLINTMPDVTLLTLSNEDTDCVVYSNINDFSHLFSDKNRRVISQPAALSPLKLTAVFDYQTLFHEFNITGITMLLIGISCTGGIVLLSWVMSKNLIYPIEHLSRKMSSQNGYSLSTSQHYLNRTDEIGTLYNEYNILVDKINTSIKRDYKDKLILLDAQMKSLEARINSHFLFNTLESINSIAELSGNEQIVIMSLSLGNMFRYSIKTKSELVTVADEMQHIRDYVSIQQIRFSNRFKITVDIEDSFLHEKMLKLILQPLVENALYHGLNYCTCGDTIEIRGYKSNGCLYLSVKDNGKGMTEEQLQDIRSHLHEEASFTELGHRNNHSIGLKNIHARIELYYGNGYGLSIDSSLGKWTEVFIKLPAIPQKEDFDVHISSD